jgi:hypothetical protein
MVDRNDLVVQRAGWLTFDWRWQPFEIASGPVIVGPGPASTSTNGLLNGCPDMVALLTKIRL